MRHTLYLLFFVDQKERVKMYSVAYLLSFSLGAVSLVMGAAPRDSALFASILTVVLVGGWTFHYCWVANPVRESYRPEIVRLGRREAALASGLLMLGTLGGLSTKGMEAAILDRRLRALTREQPLSPLQVKDITDSLR